jgi:hypothetical protein
VDLNIYTTNIPSSSKKYVRQTPEILGLTTDMDINTDLSIIDLISEYEMEHEEIVLTDYDWQTDLGKWYRRRKSGKQKYSSYHLTNTIREDFVVEKALNSSHEKIVLLYGAAHWFSLYPPFMDTGYEVVEGKPY